MIDYNLFSEKFGFYFKEYGAAFDKKILKDFYIFTDYLLEENAKYNLTSITNIDEIIIKHYIDSIIILKYFELPENSEVIDIGTGAGFPALPLYIMRRDLKITFLDGSNKKINFIRNVLDLIGGGGFNLVCGRAEDLKVRDVYDFAVSRAVAKLNILCELAAPLIRPGGFFIAYKGRNAREEITEARHAANVLGLEIANTVDFSLNTEDDKRTLIRLKKLKRTPEKYPRNFSGITKNPL